MEYNPKIAKVCPFPYYWVARFQDGEELAQYSPEGKEVLYREVLSHLEAGKGLSFIELRPLRKGLPLYRQEIDSAWQRPIIFRRHFVRMGMFGGKEEREVIFALGWQATIEGKNYKSILYIDAKSGQVLITHRDW